MSGSGTRTTREDRAALDGLEKKLFKLMAKGATSAQWRKWLRAPLEHALADGDNDLAFSLLNAGANGGAGWKGCHGRTLLDAAAEGGNAELVSAVLDAGGLEELDAVSGRHAVTPLHRALAGGHAAAARVLVLDGADMNIAGSSQRSALHRALQGGHVALAGDMVFGGAHFKARDSALDTPLHLAAARGMVKFSSMLLRRGASASVTNTKGQQPLHLAVESNHADMAEALLKAGADPNARYDVDEVGEAGSPLYLAKCDSTMTRILLAFGADPNARDDLGCTALHWAGEQGEPEVVDALVAAGSDLESRCFEVGYYDWDLQFEGLTPLHCAVICGNVGTTVTLLRNGADFNAKDAQGLTPLHSACKGFAEHPEKRSRVKAVDLLLRRGADETLTDDQGRAAADLLAGGSDPSGCLRRLLANAPADRAWRRRGLLVLCRARSGKVKDGDGDGRAGKVTCERNGVVAGDAAAAAGKGDKAGGCVLVRVVEFEMEGVFRTIISFL